MLSVLSKEVLNSKSLLTCKNEWFDRLNSVFEGRYDRKNVFAVWGIVGVGVSNPYKNPGMWVEECLEDLAKRSDVLCRDKLFSPLCVEYGIYGVHYIDKILGANVFFQDGQWYNDYLKTPVGTLKRPDLGSDATWQLTKEAVRAFVEADQGVAVFGLPTIGSALNIAVNLYGEEILVEMMAEPENASADLQVINDLLVEIHTFFRNSIPKELLQPVISWARTQPYSYGQICGCTTQLISSDLYNELIAPLDAKVLGVYENGGMIHLCGSHTQHVDSFAKMKELRAVQVNDRAAEDLQVYFERLRNDQVIYLNPCPTMTVEMAMEITGGKRLIIAEDNLEVPEMSSCSCSSCRKVRGI